jgi:ABC-type transport system involved in multi-copper enzyme maturation permease subunit
VTTPETAPPTKTALPWDLWLRQTFAILRLETKKNFLGKRLIAVYFLALAPVILLTLAAVLPLPEEAFGNPTNAVAAYSAMFQTYILRFAIFFGCMSIFTNLFRGETLEKTLHYYLLSPVKREVLVVAKYLSGLLAASLFFCLSSGICYLLVFSKSGKKAMFDFLLNGPGMGQLATYMGVTVMACVGYGAAFLLIGLYWRITIVPAGLLLLWESINFLLPSFLQKISVVHYLQSLCPLPPNPGPLAIITEPTSAWVSIPGFLGMTVLVMLASAIKVSRIEITYAAD